MERVRGAEGWQPDPLGRHDQRWMSAGTATDLVRDGWLEVHDPPVEGPPPNPPPKRHWIDVDRLQRAGTPVVKPPWPFHRMRPPLPYPRPAPPRWRVVVGVALFCCSVFTTLALTFGHAILPPPPLGRDETIGQVYFLDPINAGFTVTYAAPGVPDPSGDAMTGMAVGSGPPGTVRMGQSVLVRYSRSDPTQGTVVALSPPQSRPNGALGWFVVGVLWISTLLWLVSVVFLAVRSAQWREDNTDYRDDQWAGGTYSA